MWNDFFYMYTFCIYYRSELDSPSAGDRTLNKGKRSYNNIITCNDIILNIIQLTFNTSSGAGQL